MPRSGRSVLRRVLILAAALDVMTGVRASAEAPPGAIACSGCHAPANSGRMIPSLADRPAETIVADMQAFRTGSRPATVMDRIAKGFSDEETRHIAEWLAGSGHAALKP